MKHLNKMRNVFRSMAIAVLVFMGGEAAAQQVPFFVVVHPDNPVDMLSRDIVSSIFLKTTTRWSDGTPAEPVDQGPDSRIREAFSREVHKCSTADVQKYWLAKGVGGSLTPPPEVRNDAEAVEFVRQHRGAIAYVSTSAPLDGVLLVAIIRPPVPTKRVPPEYTARAAKMRIEGEVTLRVQVSEDGEPDEITVIEGLPYGLTESAVRAVKRWRFQPATSGGLPVNGEIEVKVKFSLP